MSDRDGAPSARSSLLSAGQNRALQLARDGASLAAALEVLVHTAETLSDGSFVASILLLDEDGKHLRHGAAPSLPDAYNRAIDGIEIGPRVGSCGTAAHFGHSVVVTDIDKDPLWADFRALALQHDLRACWSTPFHARDGSVLGTFALYYRQPRGPAEYDRTVVKELTAIASRVVENARLSAWLEGVDHPPLLDPDATELGIFTWDIAADRVVWHNDVPYRMFGIPTSDGPINAHRFVSEFLHADDQQRFAQAVADSVEKGAAFHFEGRVRRKPQGELRWVEFRGRLQKSHPAGELMVVGTAEDVTSRREPGTPLE